eukprot:9203908-Pyramimonas_sp.AAC.1
MASCPCRALRPRAGFTARGMTIYPPERWTKWSTVDEVYSSKSSREYSKYGTLTGVTWSIVDHRRLSRRSRSFFCVFWSTISIFRCWEGYFAVTCCLPSCTRARHGH